MASLRVLVFDHEGTPVQFDTWLDDLQLYLLSDIKDSVSLFDHVAGATTAPPATADSATRSRWLYRDDVACLAIHKHLPLAECAHFGQHRTAQALYDAVVARYSSPATAALGRLLLPYLFPELSAFATVEDFVSHLRASDARYRAATPAQFLDKNLPPMFITLYFIVTRLPDYLPSVRDHFLSLDPTSLTVDLLEQHLLAAETSAVAVGAARGTPRPPFFEGCSPSPLSPSYASAVAADVSIAEDVGTASASAKRRSNKGKGGRGGGGGSNGGGGGSGGSGGGSSGGGGGGGTGGGSGGSCGGGGGSGGNGGSGGGGTGGGGTGAQRVGSGGGQRQQQQRCSETQSPQHLREWFLQRRTSGGSGSCPYGIRTGDRASQTCGRLHTQHRCFSRLDDAWRAEFGDDAELPRWADLLTSRITIFDLDFDVILSAMYALSVNAKGDCYRCVLPDPGIAAATLGASESGTLPGSVPAQALHTLTLDSSASRCFFRDSATLTPLSAPVPVRLADPSRGLVVARSSTVLPYLAVPSGLLSGLHLPSFSTNFVSTAALQDAMVTTTTLGGSSLYTLATEPPRVATLLWHHRLGHPSVPRVRGMHSRLLVSGLPRSLPPLPPSTAPPCLPCVEGRQRAAPHSSLFPPTTAPLQTLHMDGSRAFVRDTSAEKLSAHAIPCVFLGFVLDAPGVRERRSRVQIPVCALRAPQCGGVSEDVTFDESVPFYCFFPYRSASPPPPPLFLDPGPPPVDPLPPQGPAPSGVASGGAEPGGADSEGVGSGGAEPRGEELGGAEPAGVETGGVDPGGAESEGAESGGAEPRGAASSGGPAGTSPRLSLQQLREWFFRRAHLRSGATGAGGIGDARAGGAGVTAGAGGIGGTAATGPGGARTRGTGAGGARAGGAGTAGAGAVDPGAGGAGDTVRPRPYFIPLLQQVLGVPSSTSLTPPLLCPPPDQSQLPLQPASPPPAPSPYTEQSGGLTERREPASRPVLPVRTTRRVPRSRPPVPGTHAMALRPSSVPLRVPLPPPLESSLSKVPDPESNRARAASPTVARLLTTAVTDPSFESAAASTLVAVLLDFAAACRLDYATALVAGSVSTSPPSIRGECALGTDVLADRQEDFECLAAAAAMDGEMASWKSKSTYVDEVLPPGANIVDGMWIFRVKRPPGSPPAFKARYVARGFSQQQGVDYFQTFSTTPKMTTLRVLLHVAAQRDYELHSLDFSTAFLQGSLHEEIWLRRPPGFIESTTLAALGFAPATADPSLILRTDTSLPPFYVLVYVDDLVFATADTEALALVKSELCFSASASSSPRHSPLLCLLATHSKPPPSDESVELSGLYPELVGCLMYPMTCTRPDLAYPLSFLARYVAPGRHRKVHSDASKRVMCYLCNTSGMGLMLGGRGPVVLTGHVDASWVDDSAMQRSSQGYTFSLGSGSVSWRSNHSSSVLSSSCEAEIYAGAMASQELRWLTYLLTDLGE
ncbi:unnamed protein product [Closterium sp. NIES-53]